MIKPQAEIFDLAANRLGIEPAECLFVDDSASHCQGARRAGMQAILYKDFPSFKEKIEKVLSAVSDN
jgi:putative hydrolase of the HAD superfamily